MNLVNSKYLEKIFESQKRKGESLLPELIKRLIINSTNINSIRIPGNDDIWAPGFDGIIESSEASMYVNKGFSVWEFGTSKDSLKKLDGDYKKRTDDSLRIDKLSTTFYLITPKIWTKPISEWENEKKDWEKVKVYDATILCDWINDTPSVCAWLLENFFEEKQLDFFTVTKAWNNFSQKTNPPFINNLFMSGREEDKTKLIELIETKSIISIKGDTTIDAIGFILSSLQSDQSLNNKAIIINDEKTYKFLCREFQNQLFVLTFSYENDINSKNRVIIPFNKEAVSINTNITLQSLRKVEFEEVLKIMGVSGDNVYRISNETNRNLLSLIRIIPGDFSICSPEWSKMKEIKMLVPLLFMKILDKANLIHQQMVEQLMNCKYSEFEKAVKSLISLEDSPIKEVDQFIKIMNYEEVWSVLNLTVFDDCYKRLILLIKEIINNSLSENTLKISCQFEALIFSLFYFSDIDYKSQDIVQNDVENIGKILYQKNFLLFLKVLPTLAEAAPTRIMEIIEGDIKDKKSLILPLFENISYDNNYCRILRTLDILAQNIYTQFSACNILKILYLKNYKYKISNSPEDSLANCLCLINTNGSLSIDDKKNIIINFLETNPIEFSKFTINLISKNFYTTCGNPRFNRDAKPKTITKKQYFETITAIADKIIEIALINFETLKMVIDNYHNFPIDSFKKLSDELNINNYSKEQIQTIYNLSVEKISNIIKLDPEIEKQYLPMLIVIKEKTISNDKFLQVECYFNNYWDCPCMETHVPYDLKKEDECDFSKRKSIYFSLQKAFGNIINMRFIKMLSDESYWGNFLAQVISHEDFQNIYDMMISCSKFNMLAGLVNNYDKIYVLKALSASSDELQIKLFKKINRQDIDELLTDENKKIAFWEHQTMWEYNDNTYNNLFKYNLSGLLNYYSLTKVNRDNIDTVANIIIKISELPLSEINKQHIFSAQYEIIKLISEIDKIKYNESLAKACFNLYNNKIIDKYTFCMQLYIFNNPTVIIDIINDDQKRSEYYFDLIYNYRLPESAYQEENKFFFFFDYIISNAKGENKNSAYNILGYILGKSISGTDRIFPHELSRKVIEKYANEILEEGFICGEINAQGIRTVDDGSEQKAKAEQIIKNKNLIELKYPRTAKLLEKISKSSMYEAQQDKVWTEIGLDV